MRWGLLAAALVAALALGFGTADASAPAVQARAYVVQSAVDGRTLAARDADSPRAMASITKLMTVLVALERLSLDDEVTVTAAAARVGESSIGLRAGQRVQVRDLVIGALVPSANDAATALAIAASGNVPRFVAAMNRKAEALGLTRTRYRNPHGLDEAGHVSSAADAAALLRAALRVPVVRRYVGMDRATLSDGRVVQSTDNLLGALPGFAGGKTGSVPRRLSVDSTTRPSESVARSMPTYRRITGTRSAARSSTAESAAVDTCPASSSPCGFR